MPPSLSDWRLTGIPFFIICNQYLQHRLIPLLSHVRLPESVPRLLQDSPASTSCATKRTKNTVQQVHPSAPYLISDKRRGWDSNPRALADKRFSRPPRYDHFDTSPCMIKQLLSHFSDIYINTQRNTRQPIIFKFMKFLLLFMGNVIKLNKACQRNPAINQPYIVMI